MRVVVHTRGRQGIFVGGREEFKVEIGENDCVFPDLDSLSDGLTKDHLVVGGPYRDAGGSGVNLGAGARHSNADESLGRCADVVSCNVGG